MPGSSPLKTIQEFVIAAGNGDVAAVDAFIQEYPASINAPDPQSWTALNFAALAGKEAVVALLLKNHASVREKNAIGWTALMCAVASGKKEIVTLLLQSGADMEQKNNDGLTALTLATQFKKMDMVELLQQWAVQQNKLSLELSATVRKNPDFGQSRLDKLKEKRPSRLVLKKDAPPKR